MDKNVSVHVSDRDHLNLTLNIYHCGNMDITRPHEKSVNYYMLYYVHEGKGSISVNGINQKIKQGSVFAVFPNKKMMIKPDPGAVLNVSWVAFSGYLVEIYLNRGGINTANYVVEDTPEQELEKIVVKLVESSRSMPNRYCKITACLYNAFAFLLDHVYEREDVNIYSPEYYLLKALDFIDIYYHENITVEQLAEYVGVTRKYLYSIFKDLTNLSPKNYLIYYRIDTAAGLLQESSLTIDNIAASVGYANQFYFSKEFKKIVGKTPSEYRSWVKDNPTGKYRSPINKIKEDYFTAAEK